MEAKDAGRAARRADLVGRLEMLRRELAAWAAWMADGARPATARHGARRPVTDVEELNAVHARLVEELERLGVQTSPE